MKPEDVERIPMAKPNEASFLAKIKLEHGRQRKVYIPTNVSQLLDLNRDDLYEVVLRKKKSA